jgi:2-amino-4-hydroxy-6-hydroxymethyldihydropteridine diphosphokinase
VTARAPEAGAAVVAYVGLGSNLGDREARLRAALDGLRTTPGVASLACSSLYETAPVGPPGQGPYLNAVARLETRLAPRALLARLQALERAAGRVRSGVRNEARTLDLDLLLYGDACIDEPGLEVPHPRLHERPFVLAPLRELAPDEVHPRLGRPVRELAAALEASEGWPPGAVGAGRPLKAPRGSRR